jgi:uncharacterized membrane protein YedE/YeeE
MIWSGFLIGAVFGALLFLAGLANPDKMIGALRLKDFHAMRVIAMFVLVGMVGVSLLDAFGVANLSIKPAAVVSILLGGGLLGVGMGITGYCPGSGIACSATGRVDAIVSVVGMLFGALAYIVIHPVVQGPLDEVANLGKTTLPEATGVSRLVWTALLAVPGAVLLWLTRPGRPKGRGARSAPTTSHPTSPTPA